MIVDTQIYTNDPTYLSLKNWRIKFRIHGMDYDPYSSLAANGLEIRCGQVLGQDSKYLYNSTPFYYD